jgi:nucleoside-diphosphate-sugar epimerase
MRRLFITGASGTLGRNLVVLAAQQGWEVHGTYHTNLTLLSDAMANGRVE